jgi:hypothetical protein
VHEGFVHRVDEQIASIPIRFGDSMERPKDRAFKRAGRIGIRATMGVLDARILQHRLLLSSRAANMPAKLRTKRAGSSVAGVSARQQW